MTIIYFSNSNFKNKYFMSELLLNLEPKEIWKNFKNLNAIPRPSKKEEKVVEFMRSFGTSLNLETLVDEVGNVIIRKPATKGMENSVPVILQSHLDMVAQKNNDVIFDFEKEGIKMKVDGDWVKAEGTTLGADNGIGVSSIMALLESKDIPHPDIEGLFTIDEETGMTGAIKLEAGVLKGKIMLNLDSERDDEMTIGCAGGVDVLASMNYKERDFNGDVSGCEINVKGLAGGHSGIDIHLYKANSNKLLIRIINKILESYKIGLNFFDGGGLRNAIPRESCCKIVFKEENQENIFNIIGNEIELIISEFISKEPNIHIDYKSCDAEKKCLKGKKLKKIMQAMQVCWNGVYRMSPDVEGLVQTSTNMARVLIKDGSAKIENLTRSSVESEKIHLAEVIRNSFELAGAKVVFLGSYPGWKPDVSAKINTTMTEVYLKNFGIVPHITACHAGLECGLIKEKYGDVDMISFGPNIFYPHSPDEKVQISSVQKFWKLLLDTLKNIPEK